MAERVVVVGGGSMGAGIAAVASGAGYVVTLVEPDPAVRRRAAERAPRATVADRVPRDPEAILAIEAVPERLDLKRDVFAALSAALPRAALATNTSSLSVADIAASASDPSRVLGMHFFNPPEKMALVEIVRAAQTSSDAIATGRAFVERTGKTAVLVADTPGFVVNRVARPFYLQALRALAAGVATAPELDALARGAGFRMGPFELMDFIGLDVNLATSESVFERTGAARFEPHRLQRELVASGKLGRKTGEGFYAYAGTPVRMDVPTGVPSHAPETPEDLELVDAYSADAAALARAERVVGYGVVGALDAQRVVELVRYAATSDLALARAREHFSALGRGAVLVRDVPGLFLGRTICGIVNEAVVAVDEGVASAEDIDLAMRLGTNYPRGPIAWGREIGAARVAQILERVARRDGAAFAPSSALERVLATGT